MAKNDVKSYVLSRLSTLGKEKKKAKNIGDDVEIERIDERIDEVKKIATNFGIKTKITDKILEEV